VVIGGGSGVGRGIALGLQAEGMSVMVADIDRASADNVRAELAMRGGIAASMQVDSTDRRSLESLAARTVGEFGAVHVLVNTVGVIFDCSLTDATDTDWSWVFELNVMAQVRAVDVFLSSLRASRARCHIVTTASEGGLVAAPPDMKIGLYTATKHALVGYSETLRAELAPQGIGVSVLCPSRVVGNLADTSARDRIARVGMPMPEGNGKPLDPATLMPNEMMGPIVVKAIRANRFFIFNRPDAIASVFAERYERLRQDAAFLAAK